MKDIRVTDFNREFGTAPEQIGANVGAFAARAESLVRAGFVVRITDVSPGALKSLSAKTRYRVRQTGPTTGEVTA